MKQLLTLWLSLSVLLGLPALGQPRPGDGLGPPHPPGRGGPPGRSGPPPIDRVLEEHGTRLGLGAEVRDAIREISEGVREEKDRLHRTLRALHDEQRSLLGAEEPDEDAVLGLADRIGAAETELHKQRLREMLRIRALLTPEQRRTLVVIHEERQDRGNRPSERGPPPRR